VFGVKFVKVYSLLYLDIRRAKFCLNKDDVTDEEDEARHSFEKFA
jgi:hypothetical protein